VSWLVELIVGLFKAIFSISMANPIKRKEEYAHINPSFDDPDDVFLPSDW